MIWRNVDTHRKGFTILEVLIALLLLGAIGGVALNAFSNATRITSSKQNTAFNLARQTLEDLKNAVRQDWWIAGSGERLSVASPGPQPASATLDGITFTRTYTVEPVDVNNDGIEDFRRVRARVNWTPS